MLYLLLSAWDLSYCPYSKIKSVGAAFLSGP